MKEKKLKTTDIVYTGVGAAIIAVCSWISIPIGTVPVTLQTLAVCLVAGLLGWKRGTLSVLIYILLGAVGVPVFSSFKGGIGALLGATGGYIIGFIFTAIITGLTADKAQGKLWALLLGAAGGILVCYAFGTAWFAFIYANKGEPMSAGAILSICVIPFLPFDAVKIILSSLLTKKLKNKIK